MWRGYESEYKNEKTLAKIRLSLYLKFETGPTFNVYMYVLQHTTKYFEHFWIYPCK